MGALADYNHKKFNNNAESSQPETKKAESIIKENEDGTCIDSEGKRVIRLSGGDVVNLSGNELSAVDKQKDKQYPFETGKGYRQHYQQKPKCNNFLALKQAEPEYIKKAREIIDKENALSDRERAYKRLVFTQKDLEEKTEKVVRNNNNQGVERYVFMALFRACRNGFLYYSIPFIINIVFLIFNFAKFNFFANISVSVFVLFNILLIQKTLKEFQSFFATLGVITLIIIADILLIYAGQYIPNFYEKIYLPYTIKLFLIASCIYYFGGYYAGFIKAYADELKVDNGNVVTIYSGPPRVGKTSSGVEDAFVDAKLKWERLKTEFYFAKSNESYIKKHGTKMDKLKFKELELAYNFYSKSKCVPCLWSNIGIFDKHGRPCHKVTLDHIKGLKRLPVYSVVFFDEIGASIRADSGLTSNTSKPLDISDMFRLGGQWLSWSVYCSEQDYNHIFIDVRRVVGENILISGREWKCKPVLLYRLYKFLYWLKSDTLEDKIKAEPRRARFLKRLGNFVNSIGFAVTTRSYRSNTQTDNDIVEKDSDGNIIHVSAKRKRWQPVHGICDYDHEAYKQLYPSYFDNKIEGELFECMQIDATDKKSYDFVNSTDLLEEKRKIQLEAIQKLK
ncbi:MAG: hypothetical protein IJR66_02335 [Clostridia bacterium]|nr:hypothetical protein [Clostridia bacterium]MBQ9513806.1 hypothetical protein [Clostridia bacterium]